MNAALIMEVLKFVMAMIPIAEKLFEDQPKSGAEKKKMVVDTAKNVTETMETVSTGGQKETWGIVNKVIDPFIDVVVSILNAFGILKK